MSKPFGWELLTEQIVDYVRSEVECCRSDASGDSEIERLLHHSVRMAAAFRHTQHSRIVEVTDINAFRQEEDRFTLFYQRQAPLEWQVDFLFWCWDHAPKGGPQGWKSLIVECDGHNSHERNKEQAARDRSRDRWAVQSGYAIFRFTGSEIWRDPLGCALQITDWAAECWP